MAASVSGLKHQQFAKSAFGIPLKSTTLSRIQPPVLHKVSYLTGGLRDLYQQIQNPKEEYDPSAKVPLLAKRYHFIRVLGKGCSATLIEAVDTFRLDRRHVAIKVLNEEYYALGYQESNNIERLNCADPQDFSGTVRLLNKFSFGGHFCLVFELLHPKPLHQFFKRVPTGPKKLQLVRKVALRLLQVLGFLQQENVIHADLKPENILCQSEDLSAGAKVIDFGNAIHCVYDELSLYYDDFELQTLLYRAPEVVYGLPFGPEIDVWSVGCILAELYLGEPLFFAVTKEELLHRMVAVLGPLPIHVFQRGKFFSEYEHYIGKQQAVLVTQSKLFSRMRGLKDYNFCSFILSFLQYNPSDRISVSDAFLHPFLAPEVAARFLMPSTSKTGTSLYHKMDIPTNTYTLSPKVSAEIAADRLSSMDLLRRGTASIQLDPVLVKRPKRAIAEVAPFASKPDIEGLCSSPAVVRVPVLGRVPVDANAIEVGDGVVKQKVLDLDTDFVNAYYAATVAYSTTNNSPKTHLPVPNLARKPPVDRSPRRSTVQHPLTEHSIKREQHSKHEDSLLNQVSSEGIVAESRKLKNDRNEGLDSQIDASPVTSVHKNQPASRKESITKKWQHNTGISTENDSSENRRTHSRSHYSPETPTHRKNPSEAYRDLVVTSDLHSSQSGGKEICIGNTTGGIENANEKEHWLGEHPHRPVMSRFKHLKKMKMDAVKQNVECWQKSITDKASSLHKEIDSTKSAPEENVHSKTLTPTRPSREKVTLPSTPSSPHKVCNDGLILLTPLSCPQSKESPIPQSLKQIKETTHKQTPKRTGRPNRQKISKIFRVKRTSEISQEGHNALLPNVAKRCSKTKLHSRSREDEIDTEQSPTEREEPHCSPRGNEQDGDFSRFENTRETRTEPAVRIGQKHKRDGESPGRIQSNVEDSDSSIGLKNCIENSGTGNPTVKNVSPMCRTKTIEDQAIRDGKSCRGRKLIDSWRTAKQSTDIKFTPRLFLRRSKSLARERMKSRNMLYKEEPWWEVSHRGDGMRREETVSEDKEDGDEDEGGRSSPGAAPQQGAVGVKLHEVAKAEQKKCIIKKTVKECIISGRSDHSLTLHRKSLDKSKRSLFKKAGGLSVSEKKTLSEDIDNFESSPTSLGNTAQLSKTLQKKSRCHTAGSKIERISKGDIEKQVLKKSRKGPGLEDKMSTSHGMDVMDQRTLKRKTSATSNSDSKSYHKKQKVKSKSDLITQLKASDSVDNRQHTWCVNAEESSPKHRHTKMRNLRKGICESENGLRNIPAAKEVISSSSHSSNRQFQLIPKDWESCFKSSPPVPPDNDDLITSLKTDMELKYKKLREGGDRTSQEQWNESNEDSETEMYLSGPGCSQITKKRNSCDDDDEVLLL